MNIRASAARVMNQVATYGHSQTDAMQDELSKIKDARDKALLQALCYGVCREFYFLDALAKTLIQKPLKTKDQDIYFLLLIGLYQLHAMRTPPHAAISETVAATDNLKKTWAKNFVNAVLRHYQRDMQTLNEKVKQNPTAFYAHPKWMIEKIKNAWPNEWEKILLANNQHPSFSLRVNLKRNTRDEYLKKILNQCHAFILPETNSGIYLEEACDVLQLPGFMAGEVSVQDGGAQLAAELLQLESGQSVLDACAAPGGKTGHVLESQSVELTAIDTDEERLNMIKENLTRLKLSARCLLANAENVASWWDGKLFDRVLLDVPCSSSGVISRHPDIKLLRKPSDISKLVEEQKKLLHHVWNVLKPGGLLLYSTCSIFPEENTQVLEDFLKNHSDAQEEKINSVWGIACHVGKQILPGMYRMDGFYYARLRKC